MLEEQEAALLYSNDRETFCHQRNNLRAQSVSNVITENNSSDTILESEAQALHGTLREAVQLTVSGILLLELLTGKQPLCHQFIVDLSE